MADTETVEPKQPAAKRAAKADTDPRSDMAKAIDAAAERIRLTGGENCKYGY